MSKEAFVAELARCNAERQALLQAVRDAARPVSDTVKSELLPRLTTASLSAQAAARTAAELQLEHGVALCGEISASLDLAALELRFGAIPRVGPEGDDGAAEAIVHGFADVVKRLTVAGRTFNAFADKASLERVLRMLAVVYRRTLCHDDEIRTLDALVELERTPERVVALCDAYGRAIDVIFRVGTFDSDDPSDGEVGGHVKEQNDDLMKLNYQFWLEYVWLKDLDEADGFDFGAWLRRFRLPVFKMLIYVSTMLGHAITAGMDERNVADAEAAGVEAMRVADLLDDAELRCIALARRTENAWPKYNDRQKQAALADMRAALERYKPQSADLASTLDTLAAQYERQSTCAKCSKPHAHQMCGRCRVVRYCGRDCQAAAWAAHKPLCQHFVDAAAKSADSAQDPAARLNALKALSAIAPLPPITAPADDAE